MTDFRQVAPRALRFIRDAWLVIGVAIAIIVALELAYRAESASRLALRRAMHPTDPEPVNPFDTTRWAADYKQDDSLETRLRWTSYVYFRNPTFTGRAISVDSEGHRRTPQALMADTKPLDLFFFGGSAAFGWYQRDAFTIPSELARQLAARNVRVTNFGVPGFVFTQELLELEMQLRAGRRPDVVVFYDGVNDVFATLQDGMAGMPENEANRAADFAAGRARATDSLPGFRADVRVAGRAGQALAERLLLLRRLRRGTLTGYPDRISSDSATRAVASVYAENARIVESLAGAYGFVAIYLWQPSLLSSEKRRTARERWVAGAFGDTVFARRFHETMRAVPKQLVPRLSSLAPGRFLDLSDLFHGETGEVFIDAYGHTYESANPELADAMLPLVERAVSEAARRSVTRAGSGP